MYELRNADTGEVVTDPAVAHGPMYDPLGKFVTYVIAVDRKMMLAELLKFLLIDTISGDALMAGAVERNTQLPEEQRIWRVMPPPTVVGEGKGALNPATSDIGVLGFLMARSFDQASSIMDAKGFPRVHGYEGLWRDPNGVNLMFVERPAQMRGRTVAVVYCTEDFHEHVFADQMLAMAERCLHETHGQVKVL